jgi:hypothetical protein
MDHSNRTVGIEQVSQDYLEPIFRLAHSGLSPHDISSALNIDIEVVHQTIALDPMHRAGGIQQLKSQELQPPHEDTLPDIIYSYKHHTGQLHRINLVTGERSEFQMPPYTFKGECCLSEVPGGGLLITGGGYPTSVSE